MVVLTGLVSGTGGGFGDVGGGGFGEGEMLRGDAVVGEETALELSPGLPIFSKRALREETGLSEELSGPSSPWPSMLGSDSLREACRWRGCISYSHYTPSVSKEWTAHRSELQENSKVPLKIERRSVLGLSSCWVMI